MVNSARKGRARRDETRAAIAPAEKIKEPPRFWGGILMEQANNELNRGQQDDDFQQPSDNFSEIVSDRAASFLVSAKEAEHWNTEGQDCGNDKSSEQDFHSKTSFLLMVLLYHVLPGLSSPF